MKIRIVINSVEIELIKEGNKYFDLDGTECKCTNQLYISGCGDILDLCDKYELTIVKDRGDGYIVACEDPIMTAHNLIDSGFIVEPELLHEVSFFNEPIPIPDGIHKTLWHLENDAQGTRLHEGKDSFKAGIDVKANKAIDFINQKGLDTERIRVAVIDDGFYEHSYWWSQVKETYSYDDMGVGVNGTNFHGTATTGLITGVLGVAPNVDLYLVKLPSFITDTVMESIYKWLISRNVRIVSNSWGVRNPSFVVSTRIEAIMRLFAQTGNITYSSGNDSEYIEDRNNFYNLDFVQVVGAITSKGTYAEYANYMYNMVVAPSGGLLHQNSAGIVTTDVPDGLGYTGEEFAGFALMPRDAITNKFSGTSASCPIVAGVQALVLSVDPTLTPSQLDFIIQNTCNSLEGEPIHFGRGLVNAYKAVRLAYEMMNGYRHIESGTKVIERKQIFNAVIKKDSWYHFKVFLEGEQELQIIDRMLRHKSTTGYLRKDISPNTDLLIYDYEFGIIVDNRRSKLSIRSNFTKGWYYGALRLEGTFWSSYKTIINVVNRDN